jgi:hypothetical protein
MPPQQTRNTPAPKQHGSVAETPRAYMPDAGAGAN